MRGINAIFSTDNPFMSQRPFSVILSRRSLSTIRPCCIVLLLLLLRAGDGYGQNFTFSPSPTSASCGHPNGAITLVITGVPTGAVAPYTYYLYPPAPAIPIAQVGNGTFTLLVGGIYGMEITDASGTYTSGAIQYLSLYESTAPAITTTSTASLCEVSNGTITATYAGGGTTPISYALNSGTYGQSGATTATFSGVGSGTNTVYAQDIYGCITQVSVIVPLSIDLYVTMPDDTTICQGTTAELRPTTNATTFAWTPATGLNNTAIADPVAAPTATTTYSLTATLGICTSPPETVTVNVLPAPIAAAVSPVGTCYGKSVELQGSGGASYQWSPSTYLSNPDQQDPIMVEPHSSVTYQLTVVGANGCTSLESATVVVNVVPPLKVYAGDDTSVVVGQTVPLDAVDVDGVGFTQFAWTPAAGLSNANIQDPTALVSESITYTVTATTPDGCQGVDSMTIKAFTSQADIFVPNAFTPNNDGHNDLLRAIPIGISQFKYFTVYNRWGQQVFTTTNASLGWDGTLSGHVLLPGTFVWVAAGVDYTGKLVQRKGVVILIR